MSLLHLWNPPSVEVRNARKVGLISFNDTGGRPRKYLEAEAKERYRINDLRRRRERSRRAKLLLKELENGR